MSDENKKDEQPEAAESGIKNTESSDKNAADSTTPEKESTDTSNATDSTPEEATVEEVKAEEEGGPALDELTQVENSSEDEVVKEATEETGDAEAEVEESTGPLYPEVVPGVEVRVHQTIKDVNPKGEEKERIQVFEGMVLARKHGSETGATITVRKVSGGVGVEKIFPLNMPSIAKIEVKRKFRVRRAKLGFLRLPKFKKRLKEIRDKVTGK